MKWVLVVVVLGSGPVQTDLVYPSLTECVQAQQTARLEMADVYNTWAKWAAANPKESGFPRNEISQQENIGMRNRLTCIPHP